MHPEIVFEDDVQNLLREHEQLARMLLEDTEAGHCEMGTRLFDELKTLRGLHERQELEKAKRALEESGLQKDLLLKELNHRVKNNLQIVSSLLNLQAKAAGAAAGQFNNAAARVGAIALVHDQLHKYDDVITVVFDRYLVDLCQAITAASSSPDRAWSLVVDADPLIISTDMAVPLGLVVNELITNAIQHSKPRGESGTVHILLKRHPNTFTISVSDPGNGPPVIQSADGFGTRIVETLARQVDATLAKERLSNGYKVTVTVPLLEATVP